MTAPGPGHRHRVTAPDGILLGGLFWESASPHGILVVRTPYDAARHAATGRSWADRGFHCLIQDVRGRHTSEGDWSPYRTEGSDGAATITAVREMHPGLPVVLYGASYAAHAALEAARSAAPPVDAVIVAVPALGLAETAYDAAGTPQFRHRAGWWHEHGRTRTAQQPLAAAELDRRTRQLTEHGVDAAAGWGWSEQALTNWRALWLADPVPVADRYQAVRTPLLVLSGDDDFFDHDARRLAYQWPGSCHFATGPWGHTLGSGVGGTILDPWLAAHGLPGRPAPWTSILHPVERTVSTRRTSDGEWRHERTTP